MFKNLIKISLLVLLMCGLWSNSLYATHIVGGELNYRFLGNNQYEIKLTVYRDCENGVPWFDNPAAIGFFDTANVLIQTLYTPYMTNDTIPITLDNPCFIPPTNVCYHVTTYTDTIFLQVQPGGYQLAYQRCCRNKTILNILGPNNSGPDTSGATYYATIPDLAIVDTNSNPVFNFWPPPFICRDVPFEFDHSATDYEGDSLVYEICTPFDGAVFFNPRPQPPFNPPYPSVIWNPPYAISNPMGGIPFVIDSETGKITATPDTEGQFVIGICVKEFRNGVYLSETKRDIQINVVACDGIIVSSIQAPEVQCGSQLVTFYNRSYGASTYTWDFGDLTTDADTSSEIAPSYQYPDTGTYQVTMIASAPGGCPDTSIKTVILKSSVLNVDFDAIYERCTDTFLVSFVNKSTDVNDGLKKWNWKFGDGGVANSFNPIYTYKDTGFYDVKLTVTSLTLCVDTMTKQIELRSKPEAGFFQIGDCSGFPNQFTDTSKVQLDTLIYRKWSFGDGDTSDLANPTHAYVDTGTYQINLVVETQSGCRDTVQDTLNIVAPPLANFSASNPCFGDSIFFLDSSFAGGNIISWFWNFGDGDTAVQQNTTHLFDSLKSYAVSLKVITQNACVDSITKLISVREKPKADYLYQNVCINAPVNFMNQSTYSGAQISNYEWDFGDGATSSAKDTQHIFFTADTFNVRLSIVADNGCTDTVYYKVPIFPLPLVDAGPEDTLCIGDTVRVSASGANSYIWNIDFKLDSFYIPAPLAYPNQSQYFYVTGSDLFGCENLDSVYINVVAKPIADAGPDLWVCPGDTIQLLGGTGASYLWQPGTTLSDSTIFNPIASPQVSTNYVLTVSDINNCSDSDTMLVQATAAVPVSAGPDREVCKGGLIEIGGAPSAPKNINFQWSPGAGLSSVNALNPTASPDTTATYIISASRLTCTGFDTVTVEVRAVPQAAFTADTVCLGNMTSFSDSSKIPLGTISNWNWDLGNSITSTLQNPTITYPKSGKYDVLLNTISEYGCASSFNRKVIVRNNPSLTGSLVNQIKCYNACDGSIFVVPDSGTIPYSYLWQGGATSALQNNLCPGQHTITVRDFYNCTTTATYNLTEAAKLELETTSADARCLSECSGTGKVKATGGNPPFNYLWNDPSQTNDTIVFDLCPGNYVVKVSDKNNCNSQDTIQINLFIQVDSIHLKAEKDTLYFGQSTKIITTTNGNFVYTWEMNVDIDNLSAQSPTVTPKQSGKYYLIATDSNGCYLQDSVQITVLNAECDEPDIFIPNAFSPNSDGANDILYVRGNAITEMNFMVFDRWGEMVFQSQNIKEGWDGNFKGEPAQQAVYVYHLSIKCLNNGTFFKKGNVTLLR